MTNKLYYNTKNNTISLDKNNWIKAEEQKRSNEDSFFIFSLNSDKYLIHQWKNYVPKCFKEKNKIVYYGDFLTIEDIPLIYCEEWKITNESNLEQVKEIILKEKLN